MPSLTALGIDIYRFDVKVKRMTGINGDVAVARADRREALVLRISGTLSLYSPAG